MTRQSVKTAIEEHFVCLFQLLIYFYIVLMCSKGRNSDATWTQRFRGKASLSLRKYTWSVCASPVPLNGLCVLFVHCFIYLFKQRRNRFRFQSSRDQAWSNAGPFALRCDNDSLIDLMFKKAVEVHTSGAGLAGVGPPCRPCRRWSWSWWRTFLQLQRASRSARS